MSELNPEQEKSFFPDEELFMLRVIELADITENATKAIMDKFTQIQETATIATDQRQATINTMGNLRNLEQRGAQQINELTTNHLEAELHPGVDLFVQALPSLRDIQLLKEFGPPLVPEDTKEPVEFTIPAGREFQGIPFLVLTYRALGGLPVAATTMQGQRIEVSGNKTVAEVGAAIGKAA